MGEWSFDSWELSQRAADDKNILNQKPGDLPGYRDKEGQQTDAHK